jgi:hypothetical protein
MAWRYLIIYYFFRIMEIRFILILIMRDVIILFIPNKCYNQILFTDESETIKKIFLYSNIIKKKIKILKKMKKITPL